MVNFNKLSRELIHDKKIRKDLQDKWKKEYKYGVYEKSDKGYKIVKNGFTRKGAETLAKTMNDLDKIDTRFNKGKKSTYYKIYKM